jgi:predicted DNA-binding protein (UPF0251 family)
MRGRKKIARCVSFDTDHLICSCFGPASLSTQELSLRPRVFLSQDELQTLVDRDINNQIMDDACRCMGVSKTVYAGIYASARRKVTQALIDGAVLTIECNKTVQE